MTYRTMSADGRMTNENRVMKADRLRTTADWNGTTGRPDSRVRTPVTITSRGRHRRRGAAVVIQRKDRTRWGWRGLSTDRDRSLKIEIFQVSILLADVDPRSKFVRAAVSGVV